MPHSQQLPTQQEELQKQYEVLSEEIQYLRRAERTDDLSPREKFRLTKQIEEAEAEREAVVRQLEALDNTVDSDRLYRPLLRLGYRQQVRTFRKLIEAESLGAFLIHGLPEYGQRWLLNRLVFQYVPYCMTGKVVTINVSRKVRRSDVSAMWRELAHHVGLRGTPSPSLAEIAEGVCRLWQTQNVLLVFHDVDCMPESGFRELLQEFWLPLAERVREEREPDNEFKLLMFLIDYEGCVATWDAPFVEKLDAAWQPQMPIRAPKIAEFSNSELTNWIEDEYDELPTPLTEVVDNAVEAILGESDGGIPELTFVAICDRCGWDWYEESDKWLKL